MCRIISHGINSSLKEHLQEVMNSAENRTERIICACHDLGKATKSWQEYIRAQKGSSPHNHSAAGGIVAMYVILVDNPDNIFDSLVALHCNSAHHTMLQHLDFNFLNDLSLVSEDEQAKSFFLNTKDGIASLLADDISLGTLEKAWNRFESFVHSKGEELSELNRSWRKLDGNSRLKAYITARNLLGRLCLMDHRSAAKQSGNSDVDIFEWENYLNSHEFKPRERRVFPPSENRIFTLRTSLKEAFLKSLDKENSNFAFIDAPTGLGKTEAMLCGGEKLLKSNNNSFNKIIFAVPQVSIADQIFEEYFKDKCHSQIWNYRRQECSESKDDIADYKLLELEIEKTPFNHNYNVTTFNQVLLAMCHPNRNRCIRGLDLHNAIIIMDEFHKLPYMILPLFFQLASLYAQEFNCRFILGSATPLDLFESWKIENPMSIPKEISQPIYQDDLINKRRSYISIGKKNIEELAEHILELEDGDCLNKNLLVVLNLVGAGSWPLRQLLNIEYNPWQQLDLLNNSQAGERVRVVLDGLVAPILRRKIVISCKKAMAQGVNVTLISTQMIEVGVDLDFDYGVIDFQGLASTIQRGGRVGREATKGECQVEVFALVNDENISSFEILNDIKLNDDRTKISPFDEVYAKEKSFNNKELKLFDDWQDSKFYDADLVSHLAKIQNKTLAKVECKEFANKLFNINSPISNTARLGCFFEHAQYLAELFDSSFSHDIIIIKDSSDYEKIYNLAQKIAKGTTTYDERKEYLQIVSDYKVSTSPYVVADMGLSKLGRVDYPEVIEVYQIDAMIL